MSREDTREKGNHRHHVVGEERPLWIYQPVLLYSDTYLSFGLQGKHLEPLLTHEQALQTALGPLHAQEDEVEEYMIVYGWEDVVEEDVVVDREEDKVADGEEDEVADGEDEVDLEDVVVDREEDKVVDGEVEEDVVMDGEEDDVVDGEEDVVEDVLVDGEEDEVEDKAEERTSLIIIIIITIKKFIKINHKK